MKLSKLAERIAQRAECPDLEKVLLGELDTVQLTDECILWKGQTIGGQRGEFGWRAMKGYPMRYEKRPYPVINYQGRRQYVPRVIFTILNRPDYEFRMTSICNVDCCVNPKHWVASAPPEGMPAQEAPEFTELGDWTEAEALEIVEIILTEAEPKTWDEVIASPLAEDMPVELIDRALISLGKEHLCRSSNR